MTDDSVCSIDACGRFSCRPPEYEPLCARHYMAEVKRAQAAAAARFQEHVRDLNRKTA